MGPRGYRKFRFRLWRRRLKAGFRMRVRRQPAEMEVREEPSERARDEAYEILAQARQTAAEIVQSAKERADAMLAAARTQAAFVTSETRNLSQEFLDSLRDLSHRPPAASDSDDPAEIVRRLAASPPERPDLPGAPAAHNGPNGFPNGSAEAAARFWQAGRALSDPSEPGPAA
jgi:hypothetical protein